MCGIQLPDENVNTIIARMNDLKKAVLGQVEKIETFT